MTFVKRYCSPLKQFGSAFFLSPPVNEVSCRQRALASSRYSSVARRPRRAARSYNRAAASGRLVIFDKAAAVDRIVVSADTDFGALLAARNVRKPSVIQFRGPGSRKPDALARVMLSNLPQLSDALERGSIVTFEPSRVRVRALPINTISVDD